MQTNQLTKPTINRWCYIKLINRVLCLLVVMLVQACNFNPDNVEEALKLSAQNRPELEKVIEHYQKLGDDEKLKAAYFLISNIPNKQSIIWKNRKDYDALYELTKKGNSNQPVKIMWDSLKQEFEIDTTTMKDITSIEASLLINNIDLAFYAWRKMPWGKHYNFDQFCEYILPYRIEDEPLENWRPFLFSKMKWFLDSLNNKTDIKEACKYLNDYVDKNHRLLPVLKDVPKLGSIDAFKNPAGICEHRLILLACLLRTFGIPCAIDYTPQYSNWAGGHQWIVLIDTNGKTISFNGGDVLKYPPTNKIPMGYGEKSATKVYRKTFGFQDSFYKSSPYNILFTEPCIDVTQEYDNKTSDLNFKVKSKKVNGVFLYTFGYGKNLIPVAYAEVKSDSVSFRNVGLNSLYVPITISSKEINYLSSPVYLDTLGRKFLYKANFNKRYSAAITRKFPDDGSMKKFGEHILGSKIEGSNNKNFRNPILLHKIEKIPYHFIEVNVKNTTPFRYLRYMARDSGFIRLSELEYYSSDNKLKGDLYGKNPDWPLHKEAIEKAFDGNLTTWFDAPAKAWFIMDIGKPHIINKIKYVQRSRINYIEIGDEYELLYFDKGWHSLGRQVATRSYLEYDNIPSNAVFLLKDHTKGKDERVFTFENGIQVWK